MHGQNIRDWEPGCKLWWSSDGLCFIIIIVLWDGHKDTEVTRDQVDAWLDQVIIRQFKQRILWLHGMCLSQPSHEDCALIKTCQNAALMAILRYSWFDITKVRMASIFADDLLVSSQPP